MQLSGLCSDRSIDLLAQVIVNTTWREQSSGVMTGARNGNSSQGIFGVVVIIVKEERKACCILIDE